MTDFPKQAPEPDVARAPRWVPSLIWVVPIVAGLIGLSLLIHEIRNAGPTIEITFATAEGIEPGKTKVKFKNVDIGNVTGVRLSEDRSAAVVEVALDQSAADFAVEDSRFWVVRPRLAGATVSGLGTLLSGVYIGVDAGRSKQERTRFAGLETPPVVSSDVPGTRFVLHAEDIGSLDVGAPVYFRRLQAGQVERFALDPDGRRITLGVFIRSPYDGFVTPRTRFWHASGIDVSFDASGFKLQTQSLTTIVAGGIAFEPPEEEAGDARAAPGTAFALAASHDAAVKTPDGEPQTVVMRFSESVRGLAPGAPVDFRGVTIGRVKSVGLTHDAATDAYFAPVAAVIYPERLGEAAPTGNAPLKIAERLVRRGLRAQLKTGNLVTGQLYVALDFLPEAVPAHAALTDDGAIAIPTVPGELGEIQASLRAILKKVEAMPLDDLAREAQRTLVTLNKTLARLDTTLAGANAELIPELRDSLRTIGATLAQDSPTQQDTRAALRAMTDAARSLKALADNLERNPESLIRGRRNDR
ncbi:Paraquat-inducible protein B [uncultured Alphaproteobacteria bacterium]|uniref:Paraquat-inducible protein B n=1 Tax=uncultured Alphaproteobacteria bacterium TaxID=91750 RepID=A0A212KJT1_9PROT|nr:Paraquat-inducible protein B [uncultured Alphaproteobacteria bacterium]